MGGSVVKHAAMPQNVNYDPNGDGYGNLVGQSAEYGGDGNSSSHTPAQGFQFGSGYDEQVVR